MSRGEGKESWWHVEKMSERESKQASKQAIPTLQSSYYCVILGHLTSNSLCVEEEHGLG